MLEELEPYLRKKNRFKGYSFRVQCAPDSITKAERIEFGLLTKNKGTATRRAAEVVAMLHFCGWIIYSKGVNAGHIARMFTLCDISDDLGSYRENETDPGARWRQCGMPFVICWPKAPRPLHRKRKSRRTTSHNADNAKFSPIAQKS